MLQPIFLASPMDYIYPYNSYNIFLLFLFSQQGVQVLFLQDNEGFVLYRGYVLAAIYRDRVRWDRKRMGRERAVGYRAGKWK